MNKKTSLLINISLSIGSAVFILLLMETMTRLLWNTDRIKTQDHVDIIVNKSNSRVVHEGVTYRNNEFGLRDFKEVKRKPGTKRILVLGDSFVFGNDIEEKDLVTTNIENYFKDKNPSVEAINAGISGFDTSDEYNQLQKFVPIYKPDMIMVFFFTNDVLQEGKDILTLNYRQFIKNKLCEHSRFFEYLYYLYKRKFIEIIGAPKFLLPHDYFNLDDSKPGWVACKQAILNIKEYTSKYDMELIFIIIPTLASLNENYPFKELREKLRNLFEINKIRYVDLFDTYTPYQPEELWASPANSHWNGLGTKLASQQIGKYITENQLLK